MVMYKIDRRGGGPKNRILGNYQLIYIFRIIGHIAAALGPERLEGLT